MHKLLYLLSMSVLAGSLFAADPLAGTWKLNIAKSKYSAPNKAKELTMVIQEQGDNNVLIMKGVAADGSPISSKLTVLKTGGDDKYSEGGPPAGTSTVVSKRKADSRILDSTTMRDGKVIGTLHAVVGEDGKTMQVTVKGTDTQGKPYENVAVYDRQ